LKNILLHIIFIFFVFQANAQSIIWEQQWTRGNNEVPERIKINRDSTFIISGAWSDGVIFYPSFFLNIDKSGNILWDTLGRLLQTGEQDIVERPTGGYLFTASTRDIANNKSTIFLQKISANGDTSAHINYPNNYLVTFPNKLLILPNGDYVIAGFAASTNNFNQYYFLQKIDSSGNEIWHKEYAYYAYQCDLILNKKGNFVLSGINANIADPNFHPYLIEVTPDGDSIGSKSIVIDDINYQEYNYHLYNNMIQTSDGGYALSGYIDSSSYQIGFIAKTDSAFNLKWTYLHRSPLNPIKNVLARKIVELEDSSIVLLGKEDTAGKFMAVKVNKNGQFLSKKSFLSSISAYIHPYDWTFLNDGSAVVIGIGSGGAYLARIGNVGKPFIEQDSCKSFAATFTAEQIGDSIEFTNTSNGGYAWADQSIWKFSDSTSSTFFSKKNLVSGAPDSVWARLTATNPYGCTNTVAKKVKVMRDCSGAPVPSFTANENSDSVFFVNTTTGSNITSYSWKFSDSTTSILANPKLKISAPLDSVWARLTVTNNNGCINTISQKAKIINDCAGAPIPSFTANQNSDSVFFVNTSTGSNIISYQWKFSDSTSSILTNPQLRITSPLDSVWARLTVTDNDGCYTTLGQKVKVSTVTAITGIGRTWNVSVSPNPFSQSTIFNISGGTNKTYKLSIVNSLGETIQSHEIKNQNTFTMNRAGLPNGLYFYVLSDDEGKSVTGKLVAD
jgi:hypothetical protein